nr:KGG domain-containing protein [Pseudoxanthomonas sp.]
MPTRRNQNSQNHQDRRGFASMDPDRQRDIAAEGGRAVHRSGNAHEFDCREARAAGRKGGEARGGRNDH